jgi:cell wall-associated NlpC family hydrolase
MDGAAFTGSIRAMATRQTLLVMTALAAGCATGSPRTAAHLPPPARESRAGTRDPGAGPVSVPATAAAPRYHARALHHDAAVHRAVETARRLVGQRDIVVDGVRYGDGCAALVRAAFEEAGRALPPTVTDVAKLHELARREKALRKGKPSPGDLVFLSDRPGGLPEHVGMVERVGAGGTATVLHRTSRGVVRLRVNAGQPWKARGDDGRILNDVLVVGGGRVPVGRLLVAFATLL